MTLTAAQSSALKWLSDRGGDGMFDKSGIVLAYGESAPHTRTTWNQLEALGLVQFYRTRARGRGRIRVVQGGVREEA